MSSVVADTHPVTGRVGTAELHRSMFMTFVDGIRTGIDVRLADALTSYRSALRPVVVNVDDQRRVVEAEIKQSKAKAEQYRELAGEWRERDKDESDRYAELAHTAARRARALEPKLAEIEASPSTHGIELPDVFTTDVDMLVRVLRRLAACDFQLTPDECADVQDIVRLRSLTPEGNGFRWCASLLVPYDGVVLELGPMSAVIPAAGLVMPAPTAELVERERAFASRIDVTFRAIKLGLPKKGAKLLALAGQHLPTLPAAVLDHLDPDVPGRQGWCEGAFLAHLVQTYSDPALRWNTTVWLRPNRQRQAIADLVAAAGGSLAGDEYDAVCHLVGLTVDDRHQYTVSPDRQKELPWLPSVVRDGSWARSTPASEAVLRSRLCPSCAQPATGVLRVPCVPGSLVCRRCGETPAARGLRVPPDYLRLLLPETTGLEAAMTELAAYRRLRELRKDEIVIVPGRAHGRYSDKTLTRLLRQVAGELVDPDETTVVDATLQRLGYVRRGGAAAPRLRRLWQAAGSH